MNGRTVVPGIFDGVHLGHQFLLRKAKEIAGDTSLTVLTFHPHPHFLLSKEAGDFLLTTPEEKEELLKSQGVQEVITLNFNEEIRNMTPERFFGEVLVEKLKGKNIVVGEDFRFGKGREGDVEKLIGLGYLNDVKVFVYPPFKLGNEVVKSEKIRRLLKEGEVRKAREMLGRFYSLRGKVVKGEGLGRKIGYPTANLEIPKEKLLPAKGIYAVMAKIGGEFLPAVCYIGDSPTLKKGALSCEVHIFWMDKDILGKGLEVCFVEKIREEKVFPSIEELVRQIEKDVEEAKRILYTMGGIKREVG
ncbi:MAG: bifunctional riboflavin kinase/FAD synthetase [bacterium]